MKRIHKFEITIIEDDNITSTDNRVKCKIEQLLGKEFSNINVIESPDPSNYADPNDIDFFK